MTDLSATIPLPFSPDHGEASGSPDLLVEIDDGRITDAGIAVAYDHRALERWCESGSYPQALDSLRRTCGVCGHAHAPAFLLAVERILGTVVPSRGAAIRAVLAELERARAHLQAVGVSARAAGLHSLAADFGRDCSRVVGLLGSLTGPRRGGGIDAVGGPLRDISAGRADELKQGARWVEERGKRYLELFLESEPIVTRLAGIGVLPTEAALRLGALGPVARASGVDRDLRRSSPYGVYADVPFETISSTRCDALGRAQVRLGELVESCRIVRRIAGALPPGPCAVSAPRRVGSGEALCRVESPSGEELEEVVADGTDRPLRIEIRTPALTRSRILAAALVGGRLEDICLVASGVDPMLAEAHCTVSIRERGSRREVRLGWNELQLRGVACYRKRGVDLSTVRAS